MTKRNHEQCRILSRIQYILDPKSTRLYHMYASLKQFVERQLPHATCSTPTCHFSQLLHQINFSQSTTVSTEDLHPSSVYILYFENSDQFTEWSQPQKSCKWFLDRILNVFPSLDFSKNFKIVVQQQLSICLQFLLCRKRLTIQTDTSVRYMSQAPNQSCQFFNQDSIVQCWVQQRQNP